ncbi:tRNA adenosine(34) deaminase TadA [Malikia spinosa]|uniref:tRNA-specific adenosine deaminase n=2 Tax=Malikia spinosa TaxID=86180 RepID=A0A2S9KCX6_9BURK|nr:tRNA adenosine(34) deaminase TadA [Malikia spinosa]
MPALSSAHLPPHNGSATSIDATDWPQARDLGFMRLALDAARQSAQQGEVPVGAVLVRQGRETDAATASELLACSHNQPIGLHDPTAHAEMLALREAARKLGNYRLDDCELYVTLEPCAMCAQAMLHARLKRVVYGAREPKTGAAGSVLDLFGYRELNHQTEVVGGVLAEECGALMQEFFASRRRQAKQAATPLREDALRTPERRFAPAWQTWPQLQPAASFEQDLPELQGLRLHALDLGPRPAESHWLALHGPDAWWPQLADWAQFRCEAGERVLLPDLIGFGQSDKPKKSAWHQLEQHLALLLAWLDSRGVQQFNIAYAPGQQVLAQRLREAAPQRVGQLLALDGPELGAWTPELGQAPFPDAGHQAGPLAWRAHGWDTGLPRPLARKDRQPRSQRQPAAPSPKGANQPR